MERHDTPPARRVILVCTNARPEGKTSCGNRGSEELLARLKDHVNENGLKPALRVTRCGCLGLCAQGPNIAIEPDRAWLSHVAPGDLPELTRTWLRRQEDPPEG